VIWHSIRCKAAAKSPLLKPALNHKTMKHTFPARKCLLLTWSVLLLTIIMACKKESAANSAVPGPDASPYSLTARSIALSDHCKGFYEYLPAGYLTDPSNTSYPLIIFFHGAGEIGNGSSELHSVLKNGPLKLVSDGTFPAAFNANGKSYRFLIIAPQFTSSDDVYPDEIDGIIEYAKKQYRVDASRIYLTGLSFGGGQCWNYVGKNAAYAKKIAAIVPIAAYINEARAAFKIDNGKAHFISASGLPIWSTHNEGDEVCPVSWVKHAHSLVENMAPASNGSVKLTVFNANIHEGWTRTYDPSFRENGMNIYEWMLQYRR
jgi:predicted peptidase